MCIPVIFWRHSSQKWVPGKIVGRSGNVTFTVQFQNNSHVRRLKNHIRNRPVERIPELDCTLQQNIDQHTQQTRSSQNNDHQRYPTTVRNPAQQYSDDVWS